MRGWLITMLLWPSVWLLAARGQLFVWVPVFISIGVGTYFALPEEPHLLAYGLAALAFALGALGGHWAGDLPRPFFIALACVAAGFAAAGLRAQVVAAPVLSFHYYGPVQGRVAEIDRSASDALRISLVDVVLSDVGPSKTPARVRISLQGARTAPEPGQIVMLTAHLSAPEGAAEPGGFDFRRMAYFQRLGAVGYTRAPVMLWEEARPGRQWVDRLRARLSASLMAAAPSDAGAFANGAMTGDRAHISKDTVEALRDSNLAHLLAISGMNLAFLSGFVFMLVRYGLALIPAAALRVNSKKIAAVIALAVAGFYLALSGANVATTRAFLMIAVMLGAILLDRRALTMRSVALAAIALLIVTPESLLDAGFQLSFAATVVLIGGYRALDRAMLHGRLPRWFMPIFTLVLTSVLAGLATAPFAAAHFNRFTDYGLVANLLTVPVMSVLMAAGAVAALLAPIGASAPAIWVMEKAGEWILFIAHWVAGLDGAVMPIIAPQPLVLPLLTLGGLWALVWQGRRALLGLPVVAVALGLWAASPRPDLMISADGRLVGLMGPAGRALSSPRGAGFAAETWLQHDGDLATQEEAAVRAGFTGPPAARSFAYGGFRGVVLSGKDVAGLYLAACATHDLVILPAAFDTGLLPAGGSCTRLDRAVLDVTGALSGQLVAGDLVLTPANNAPRLWAKTGRSAGATIGTITLHPRAPLPAADGRLIGLNLATVRRRD